ncbi:MAG: hypothetical protein GY851_17710 [bacterium]|nr:hypothetical protein [bacterium]
MKHSIAVSALLILLAASCARTPQFQVSAVGPDPAPGTLQTVEPLGEYGATKLRALLWLADLPDPVTIRSGVKLYRLQYWTTNHDGAKTLASGLLALPKKGALRGVVSYQHGTNPNRHLTPSQPTLGEGVLGSALFAGGGYAFVAPDYIGLGTSHEVHPYFHRESTVSSVIDLLKAAYSFTTDTRMDWPNSVYLTGFSQGGHATLATHRALESMDDPRFRVAASAPAAGPYDLAGIALPVALEGGSDTHTFYLGYLANAYSVFCGQPIESLVRAPYAAQLPVLFDGEHEPEAIWAALSTPPRGLFTESFLKAYDNEGEHWFLEALARNSVVPWAAAAPIRFYHGQNDADVSPRESLVMGRQLRELGVNVTTIYLGRYTHDESVYRAVTRIRLWFDEVAEQADVPN